MNDAEAEFQKKRVNRYLKKWKPAGFDWWKITCEWDRGAAPDNNSIATVNCNWEYREATITFYLMKLSALSDEDVEGTVVHELSHLLVDSISDYSDDAHRQMTEYAVSCVAQALLWAHEFVVKKP